MNKAKLVFNHTLMISTAILFGMGIRTAVLYFKEGQYTISWQWYIPLSIVAVGFLCSLASLLLLGDDGSMVKLRIRICLHCLLVFCIVSLCGYLFDWYSGILDYLIIVVMYVIIYAFVWISTSWMLKADEKKINDAISKIRDEE